MIVYFKIIFLSQSLFCFFQEFELLFNEVSVVDYSSAVGADQVMVVLAGGAVVEFIPGTAVSEIEFKNQSHLGQKIKSAVDRGPVQ